jgi:hypothetical protein
MLKGIVSLSPRRTSTFYCDPFKYAVFTKIAIYTKWIKEILELVEREEQQKGKTLSVSYEPVF